MSVLSVTRRTVFGVGRLGGGLGFVVLGALAPTIYRIVAPVVGEVLRPVIRGVIKGGVLLVREVQGLAGDVREDIEEVAAEAREEIKTPPKPRRPRHET